MGFTVPSDKQTPESKHVIITTAILQPLSLLSKSCQVLKANGTESSCPYQQEQ